MKTSLDHLPLRKQRELDRVIEILFEEFDDYQACATQPVKKRGRILKIILFGSYARGDFVEDRPSGYFSDFDILLIVNQARLTDMSEFWYKAEDRFFTDRRVKTVVNMIVHTLHEVNLSLKKGHYFFTDIKRDGIVLYEMNRQQLKDPEALDPDEAAEISADYLEAGLGEGREFLINTRNGIDRGAYRNSAFQLHQATEQFYTSFLLARTHYTPPSHNIRFLRSLAEDIEPALRDAWPRDKRRLRTAFELLKRAYVEARYSKHYKISREQLEWLIERVGVLQKRIAKTGKNNKT